MMEYRFSDIETRWKQYWEEHKVYKVSNDASKPKYYVLDMFPYPSGAGLHVGHPLGYIASDIYARYKRLNGFNVLHPMGYDAFGLPAEQYAIQTGVQPAISTAQNIVRYRGQLDNLGFSFDWDREVQTSDPSYYKWTQWIFLQLFSHYYDTEVDAARPVSALEAHFSKHGSAHLKAVHHDFNPFTASDWQSMSKAEKEALLMNFRLAYRKVTFVNWCEALGTVLANDEVKEGVSERGGHPVEKKPMMQWSLRITAYAERLLNDLQTLEFSDAMKKMQSNWIGRSEGATMFFEIEGFDKKLEIFTTRPDTLFGVTFMVLAPEHEWVDLLTSSGQKATVAAYLTYVQGRSERERMAEVKEVTGAFLGSFAINPFNGKKIPIYIGEYVLKDYGTGAIMAVPSDDDRDHLFALKYGLEIIEVIDKSSYPGAGRSDKLGIMINSEVLDGMEVPDAIEYMLREIESKGVGSRQINYKLRDAIYSRQRYWGEPFPIIYNQEGTAIPLEEKDLPLELPILENFQPASGAVSPLARAQDWVNLPDGMKRETDTMPGFAGSSWYFLRYMDPTNDQVFAGDDALTYWQDVDLYVGGTEHAVGHLMYSRFWHKFLFDLGKVPTIEPYKKLINQGMIQGVVESIYLQKEKEQGKNKFICASLLKKEEEKGYHFTKIPVLIDYVTDYGNMTGSHLSESGVLQFIKWRPEFESARFVADGGIMENGIFTPHKQGNTFQLITFSEVGKMSKSLYNVINPDDVVSKYGADCFRMYEMFLGPVEQAKPWDTKGIDGVYKFLRKVWQLFRDAEGKWLLTDQPAPPEAFKVLHTAIKKIQDDITRFSFNTCVSGFMIAVNDFHKMNCHHKEVLAPFLILLAPFAPFLTEELWHQAGNKGSIHHASFPVFDGKYLEESSIEYPVSINGKLRANLSFDANGREEDIKEAALQLESVKKWTAGQKIVKIIVVPKRMINIVLK
jgi:leucyl-tRNA synthetase